LIHRHKTTQEFTMKPIIYVIGAAIALTVGQAAQALPAAGGQQGGGDPAPKPLLSKPPAAQPATRPVAVADTTAMLPPGKYTLALTLKQKTLTGPVEIARSGVSVTATMSPNESLSGTLDASGKLQLSGGSGADSLQLAATVQSQRAVGSVRAGLGATQLAGSFTLDPVTGARKPMQVWGTDQGSPAAPPPAPGCGFWCGFKKWLGL
jgi:hypothetical protein